MVDYDAEADRISDELDRVIAEARRTGPTDENMRRVDDLIGRFHEASGRARFALDESERRYTDVAMLLLQDLHRRAQLPRHMHTQEACSDVTCPLEHPHQPYPVSRRGPPAIPTAAPSTPVMPPSLPRRPGQPVQRFGVGEERDYGRFKAPPPPSSERREEWLRKQKKS